jgi:hypothetical protein
MEFNKELSDTDLMAAIQYYQDNDGSIKRDAPTAFLNHKQIAMIHSESKKIKTSLYKALLFIGMADAIK